MYQNKRIKNYVDFVNEGFSFKRVLGFLKSGFINKISGPLKAFYDKIMKGKVRTIPSGKYAGYPIAMYFTDENGPIDKQLADYYNSPMPEKTNEGQLQEAVSSLESEDSSIRNVNAEQLKELIFKLYQTKVDDKKRKGYFIYGAPGIGKTQIVGQCCTEFGIGKLMVVETQYLLPEDLVGVPSQHDIKGVDVENKGNDYLVKDFGKGFTRMNPPNFLPWASEDGKGGVLFFDELNRADSRILSSLLTFVQTGKLGDYHLPKGWIIVAAGNRSQDTDEVPRKLDSAFTDRFKFVNYVPELGYDTGSGQIKGGWAKHVEKIVIPELIYFLADNKELFHKLDKEAGFANYPTPRSWTDASEELKDLMELEGASNWRELDPEEISDLFHDHVGFEAATRFAKYLEIIKELSNEDIQNIIKGDKVLPNEKFKQQKSYLYAVMQSLISRIDKDDPGYLEKVYNIFKYMDQYDNAEILTWLKKRFISKFPSLETINKDSDDEKTKRIKNEIDLISLGKINNSLKKITG